MAATLPADGSAGDPLGDNMSSLTRTLDQLGLALRKTTEPLDVIVIDKVERVPLPNWKLGVSRRSGYYLLSFFVYSPQALP